MTAQPEDDSWIDRWIEHFCQPAREIDETPQGRLAGMDLDAGLVLAEMRALLTGRVTAINRAIYAQRLAELLEQYGDLHQRRERAYEEIIARRWVS